SFLSKHPTTTALSTLSLHDALPISDVYGRTGNSGVSIATLDDMKKLYSGFDLCSPSTSVSMTINGPAPMILAMFMNTAVDQQVEDRKSTRLNSSHVSISYAVFCLKK